MSLADEAVRLGTEWIWTVEHNFTDCTMCPDPTQLFTWVAARHVHTAVAHVDKNPWDRYQGRQRPSG
jgi:hypothetical protein